MAVERTYRGITPRLAVHYLENLGGETTASDGDLAAAGARATVEADDWCAELTSSTVGVGPTLTLTEVAVTFEGDSAVLGPLVEEFSQKAMRAGG